MTTKRRPTWFYPAIAFGATLCLGLAAIAAFAVLYFTMLAPTTPPAPVAAVAGPPTAIPTIALPPTFTPTATLLPTETPAATPTGLPTATPIPLGQINLEPLLIQPGDLPSGYVGGQIRRTLPAMFDGVPPSQNKIYQELTVDGHTKGGVSVMLYETLAEQSNAYAFLLDGMDGDTIHAKPVEGVGNMAHVIALAPGVVAGVAIDPLGDILFSRCGAVVLIRMTFLKAGLEVDQLSAYAQRLDQRLAAVVCKDAAPPVIPEAGNTESMIRESLGSGRLMEYFLDKELGIITIRFLMSDGNTPQVIQQGARLAVTHIVRDIATGIDQYQTVSISGALPITDAFGNTTIEDVLHLTYRSETIQKINWANFNSGNIFVIADVAYVYPRFVDKFGGNAR